MRIVFVASEVVPFAKTGGLADVCGTLPLALERLGHEIIVIMPRYSGIAAEKFIPGRVSTSGLGQGIKVYFIENKKFFDRPHIYGGAEGDYPDSLERFSFFCHEALRLLKDLKEPVDIIHCHDWQTGLLPLLVKKDAEADSFFQKTRVVLTLHNLAYQGVFPKGQYSKLGIGTGMFNEEGVEFHGKINLLKAGILFSDLVTTVSPGHAREIVTSEFGYGLEELLRQKKGCLVGILNGLDYDQWNPQTDPLIQPNYSDKDWLAKKILKKKLQSAFKLPSFGDIPIFGFVSRLCYQKGIDLFESAFESLMERPIQVVLQGVGEDKYQKIVQRLAKKYPQKFSALIKYDESLAHLVFAGSDFLLMPSVYEPCGLTQMIALRYGTVPIASYVGGLADTIVDLSEGALKGNGIVMPSYSVSGLLESMDRATGFFHQKDKMNALVTHAMSLRWTWDISAKRYIECYEECLK
ncbi:MAG: glycogen synthase [Candidatus Omnitrophica bacterium]|nr:glycogen synthase [Candidatus Omnitrophota bacterium]